MPYDMQNPEGMSYDELKSKLCKELNHVCTYLFAGSLWHLRAANASRKILVRGPGRWHDDGEATNDFCSLKHLLKISRDKLGYDPRIDMEVVARAEPYTMGGVEDFKAHFAMWDNNESELIDCLNKAINLSRSVDADVYEKLICLIAEVQNERMRLRMTRDSFTFGGWNSHDISVKSKWIHEYMEHEHKDGEDINFNLG